MVIADSFSRLLHKDVPSTLVGKKAAHIVSDSELESLYLSLINIGCLYSILYKSIFGTSYKVRCNTCDKARPLSQV
jgi:hypothetical protein